MRLRHELIHNPDLSRVKLSPDEWTDLHLVASLILACDDSRMRRRVLLNFISENLDEEIKQNIDEVPRLK